MVCAVVTERSSLGVAPAKVSFAFSDSCCLPVGASRRPCRCSQGDRGGDREAVEAARRTHQGLRPERGRGQRAPPHRLPRDVEHPRLLGRRRQPRREHPHPAPGGRGRVRLLRGPASVVQLRPVLGHRDTRQDVYPRQVDGRRCCFSVGRVLDTLQRSSRQSSGPFY